MSKKEKNRFDRRTMRAFAVNTVFAYDFVLKEQEQTKEGRPGPEKQKKAADTVIIKKSLGNGTSRRSKITRLEYEEKYAGIMDILEELRGEAADGAEDASPKPFDTEEFIQEVLSSLFEDEGREQTVFRDLPDYDTYLYPVVDGVIKNIDEIDALISGNLVGWSISRVRRTDLAIMRVAAFELKYFSDVVPREVAINEAVEAAKKEDDKAGTFVNGVLAGIVRTIDSKKDA
ncbi:MAG: transcription antitermination factor NusB [Clostridia bacterium]|nr:transcription antitermination factor NusB [Clostridia bacterium]